MFFSLLYGFTITSKRAPVTFQRNNRPRYSTLLLKGRRGTDEPYTFCGVDWCPIRSNRIVSTRRPSGDIFGRRAMQGGGLFAKTPSPLSLGDLTLSFVKLLCRFRARFPSRSRQLRFQSQHLDQLLIVQKKLQQLLQGS